MLSHGHWDHAGAMPLALDLIKADGNDRRIPVYMHPGMFGTRAMRAPDGTMREMADIPSVDELESQGGDVRLARGAETILDRTFLISGEIPRITPFERGMPGQFRRTADGKGWEPDPLLVDERSLAVHVANKGLVVLSACSHAGIVNVLTHARTQLPGAPILCIMGGLHLSGENEKIIGDTVEALREFDIEVIAAGHCTGWRAITALSNAFGSQALAPLAVGKVFSFGQAI
jgi:7,8-dihydropterin-6-yl-methyl-4-(beta-D-ribofuranosyl)aminobenzene 5'-phosphate synthase